MLRRGIWTRSILDPHDFLRFDEPAVALYSFCDAALIVKVSMLLSTLRKTAELEHSDEGPHNVIDLAGAGQNGLARRDHSYRVSESVELCNTAELAQVNLYSQRRPGLVRQTILRLSTLSIYFLVAILLANSWTS